jgi:signal transduction histidine kinase
LASLLLRMLFSSRAFRGGLGEFAPALDLAAGLGLTATAMAATGGLRSELYVLLLTDMVLAWRFLGAAATRYLAAGTLVALGVLAAGETASAAALAPLAFRGAWPILLLAVFEIRATAPAARPAPARPEERAAAIPPSPPPAAEKTSPPPRRDPVAEILHDLKSPLSVIRVYADLISERARRGEPPVDDHVVNLQSEIALIESMVGVAPRSEQRTAPARRPRRLDLIKMLGDLAKAYRLTHGEKLHFEFIAERPELLVMADELALQRAFRNVLDNAVKFTAAGGQVRIRAGAAGAQAFVVISDTGAGMTPEERDRAFEFSFRGAGARSSGVEGRGLGLGLSRELVEANGGKISLSSEPGHGSDVTILFPMEREVRL